MPSQNQDKLIARYTGQQNIVESVMSLERRNFSKADSWASIMAKEVKRQNTTLLFCSLDNKVVAYIIYTTTQLKVHISKVAVDKAYRRKGIARELVKDCLQRAVKERSVMCSTLHVDPANEAARQLYLSMGFVCDGILDDYYAPSRPCWKMMKGL